MDKYTLYVPNFLPCKEFFVPEKNQACPGCGLALAVRQVYKAVENRIEKSIWQLPSGINLFKRPKATSPVGSTKPSFLKIRKGKGDLILCFDNEAEGSLSESVRKSMPAVAVAEGYTYVATACPSYPFDLYEKIQKGLETEASAYIHILCPCPVGWQFEPELTVNMGRWAVESKAFLLYEVHSENYRMTVNIAKPRVLAHYLKAQKRFEDLSDKEIEEASAQIDVNFRKLSEKLIDNVQEP
jgi:pyruvate/2-oxoacid:ferredoxin oxidoreductase beta subunit